MPPIPPQPTPWPIPKLSLRIDDLSHPGARIFLNAVVPLSALRDACIASFEWLYTPDTAPKNVQTVTLILRSMPGVAHTTGNKHHKEIHYSLEYIEQTRTRARDEIKGVLTHEAVHCFQYDAGQTCNGGLIEGIADYVRLNASLAPPHWPNPSHPPVPSPSRSWDAGYETTAYFLAWLEKPAQYGPGTIKKLNACLEQSPYRDAVFEELLGAGVHALWEKYCTELEEAVWEVVDSKEGEGEVPVVRKKGRSLSVGALLGWA
ncbi:hypothetical protein C0991_010056 [Blastosporella zonata]|nr:hypothetical protein C0991_010056 [Blastosporella zonata]